MGKVILGALIGFAVAFLGVMGATWAAAVFTGLGMEDDPTGAYLVLNLLGSFLAAGLGGFVAVAFAGGRMASAWLLAAAMAVLSLGAILGEPAARQPSWYPLVVAALGVAGVALGGVIASRGAGRASAAGSPGGAREGTPG